MAQNQSQVWLYNKLRGSGMNVGASFDEFRRRIETNEASRKWCWDKAQEFGWNVGADYAEFSRKVSGSILDTPQATEVVSPTTTPTADLSDQTQQVRADAGLNQGNFQNLSTDDATVNTSNSQGNSNPYNVPSVAYNASTGQIENVSPQQQQALAQANAPEFDPDKRLAEIEARLEKISARSKELYRQRDKRINESKPKKQRWSTNTGNWWYNQVNKVANFLDDLAASNPNGSAGFGGGYRVYAPTHAQQVADGNMSGTSNNGAGGIPQPEDNEIRDLMAESLMLDKEARTIRNQEVAKNRSGVSNLLAGAWDAITNPHTWTWGWADLHYATRLLSASEHMENLTEAQQNMLSASANLNFTQGQYDPSLWYSVGNIAGESVPFMVELALTSGSGAVMEIGTKAGTRLATKAATKWALNTIEKKMIQYAGTALVDFGVGLAYANTTGLARTMADYDNRRMGQVYEMADGSHQFGHFETDADGNQVFVKGGESAGAALWKAEVANALEYYTEILGGHMEGIGGAIIGKAQKGAERYGLNRIGAGLGKMIKYGEDFSNSAAAKMFKSVGFNGLIGEGMEEEANLVLNSLLVGDNKFSDLWDPKQQAEIWLGMAFSTGAMHLIGTGVNKGSKAVAFHQSKKKLADAETIARMRLTEDVWKPLQERIDNADNENMGEVVMDIINDPSLHDEEKKAVLEYVRQLVQFRGFNQASMVEAADEAAQSGTDENSDPEDQRTDEQKVTDELESAYTQGVEDALEPNHVSRRLRHAAEVMTGGQDIAAATTWYQQWLGDKTVAERIQQMRDEGSTEDEITHAMEFCKAMSAYQGMQQAIEDEADSQDKARREMARQATHTDGSMRLVTLKGGSQVFIVGGGVIQYSNGVIDRENSSEVISVYDPESGNRWQTKPSDVVSVDDYMTPDEIEADLQDKKEQTRQALREQADGKINLQPGATVNVGMDESGNYEQVRVLGTDGTNVSIIDAQGNATVVPINQLQDMSDAVAEQEFLSIRDTYQEGSDNGQLDADAMLPADVASSTTEEDTPATPSSERTEAPIAPGSFAKNDEVVVRLADGTEVRGMVSEEPREDGSLEIAYRDGKKMGYVDIKADEIAVRIVSHKSSAVPTTTSTAEVDNEQPIVTPTPPATDELIGMARQGDELARHQLESQGVDWHEPTTNPSPIVTDNAMPEERADNAHAEGTALSRVPYNEERKDYDYEAVDADTAFDAITEQVSDPNVTTQIANDMVSAIEADIKAEEKKPSTGVDKIAKELKKLEEGGTQGGSVAERIAFANQKAQAIAQKQAELEEAKRASAEKVAAMKEQLAKWQEIAGVQARRAAQSQGDAVPKIGESVPNIEESTENAPVSVPNNAESAPIQPQTETSRRIAEAIAEAQKEGVAEPTNAQKEAGNYKKAHVKIGNLDISIENPIGSTRSGKDAKGNEWSTTMQNSYGYIRGTESVDGDHIDTFLNDEAFNDDAPVFVIDQTNEDGSFDEHKVMLGFNTKEEAMQAYLNNYDSNWMETHPGIRITETSRDNFGKWIESSHRKTKPFAEYGWVKDMLAQQREELYPEPSDHATAVEKGESNNDVEQDAETKQKQNARFTPYPERMPKGGSYFFKKFKEHVNDVESVETIERRDNKPALKVIYKGEQGVYVIPFDNEDDKANVLSWMHEYLRRHGKLEAVSALDMLAKREGKAGRKQKNSIGKKGSDSVEHQEPVNNVPAVVELAEALGRKVVFDGRFIDEQHAGYVDDNGVIHINPNMNVDAQMSAVIGHELTHTVEGTQAYSKLVEFLKNNETFKKWLEAQGYDSLEECAKAEAKNRLEKKETIEHQAKQENRELTEEEKAELESLELTDEEAEKEIVADFCGEMILSDRRFTQEMLSNVKETRSILERIIDAIREFIDRLTNRGVQSESQTIKDLRTISGMLTDALRESRERENRAESKPRNNVYTYWNQHTTDKKGNKKSGRELLADTMRENGKSKKEINRVLRQMDNLAKLAEALGEGYPQFKFWSETEPVVGEDGVIHLSCVVRNAEYPMNIDFSIICKKKEAATELLDYLVKEGDPSIIKDGKIQLNKDNLRTINNIVKQHGFEMACDLCFVEAKRFGMSTWANSFIDFWNPLVKVAMVAKLKAEGKLPADYNADDFSMGEFNFRGSNEAETALDETEEVSAEVLEAMRQAMTEYIAGHPEEMRTKVEPMYDLKKDENGKLVVDESRMFTRRHPVDEDGNEIKGEWEKVYLREKADGSGFEETGEVADMPSKPALKEYTKVKGKGTLYADKPIVSKMVDLIADPIQGQKARKMLNAADLVSHSGMDGIINNFFDLYKIVNIHGGVSKPKSQHGHSPYVSAALTGSSGVSFSKEKAFHIGGVRNQSFSDYEAMLWFDYMQLYADMGALGMPMQVYTKEPAYARLFGMMGSKINLSLLCQSHTPTINLARTLYGKTSKSSLQTKVWDYLHDHAGLRPVGGVALEAFSAIKKMEKAIAEMKPKGAMTEEMKALEALLDRISESDNLDEWDYNWGDQTFPAREAFDIISDPNYSANVGTILVAVSDKMMEKALSDPRIKMVIPYHKSGLPADVALSSGVFLYKDYSKWQTDKKIDKQGKAKEPKINFYDCIKVVEARLNGANVEGVKAFDSKSKNAWHNPEAYSQRVQDVLDMIMPEGHGYTIDDVPMLAGKLFALNAVVNDGIMPRFADYVFEHGESGISIDKKAKEPHLAGVVTDENGMPKFSEQAETYFKKVEDFNMIATETDENGDVHYKYHTQRAVEFALPERVKVRGEGWTTSALPPINEDTKINVVRDGKLIEMPITDLIDENGEMLLNDFIAAHTSRWENTHGKLRTSLADMASDAYRMKALENEIMNEHPDWADVKLRERNELTAALSRWSSQGGLNFGDTESIAKAKQAIELAIKNGVSLDSFSSADEAIAKLTQEAELKKRKQRNYIGKKARAQYEALLEKKRPDMPVEMREAALDYLHSLEDTKENNRKVKIAVKWLADGAIRLPEDIDKVNDALSVADKAKVDPMAYRSPMELLDTHKDFKPSRKPIDPETVPTLTKAYEVKEHGIVVYDVYDDTENFSGDGEYTLSESRQAMREIINTHFGEDCSPWCLLQGDGKGNLTEQSEGYWNHYDAVPKQVAFQNGKLLAFRAIDDDMPDQSTIEKRIASWLSEEYAEGLEVTYSQGYGVDIDYDAYDIDSVDKLIRMADEFGVDYDAEAFEEYRNWLSEEESDSEEPELDFDEIADECANMLFQYGEDEYRDIQDHSYEYGGDMTYENGVETWWDRQDASHVGIPATIKIEDGWSTSVEINPLSGETMKENKRWKGNRQKGRYEEYDDQGNHVIENRDSEGKEHGEQAKEKTYKDRVGKDTYINISNYEHGKKHGVQEIRRRIGEDEQIESREVYEHGELRMTEYYFGSTGSLSSRRTYFGNGYTLDEEFNNNGTIHIKVYKLGADIGKGVDIYYNEDGSVNHIVAHDGIGIVGKHYDAYGREAGFRNRGLSVNTSEDGTMTGERLQANGLPMRSNAEAVTEQEMQEARRDVNSTIQRVLDMSGELRERIEKDLPSEATTDEVRFREREDEEPKKTVKVYKMMRMVNGELYPLFIDSATPTKLGVWYDADSPNLDMLKGLPAGNHMVNFATGETMTQEEAVAQHPEWKLKEDQKQPNVDAVNWATENGWRWMEVKDTETKQSRYGENRAYNNYGINGSGSVETYAMRPGWHAGSLPTMRQIGLGQNKDLRDGRFVWVEGRMSADVDYQSQLDAEGKREMVDQVPVDGYYMMATNANKKASQADKVGWYIGGSFVADRILSDAETREVIDRWNADPEHADMQVEYDYSRENERTFDAQGARDEKSKVEAAQALAERLGKKVRIVTDVSELKRMPEYKKLSKTKKARMLRSQGWINTATGEIVVVIPNNLDVADIKKTMLHEVVGHYGLQQLVGKENFKNFLSEVFKHADAELRAKITDLAKRRGWDYQLATEEFIAGLAERGFDDMNEQERTLWQKIKDLVQKMLDKLMGGEKLGEGVEVSENDLRYMLWRSYQMQTSQGVMSQAENVMKQRELGVGAYSEENVRFRDDMFTQRDLINIAYDSARDAINAMGYKRETDLQKLQDARDAVARYIRKALAASNMPALKKMELNKLLSSVKQVRNRGELESHLRKVEGIMWDVDSRMERRAIDKLLGKKLLEKNHDGVSVGKTVDDNTRKVLEAVKGKLASVKKTDVDMELHALGSEAYNIRKEIEEKFEGFKAWMDAFRDQQEQAKTTEADWDAEYTRLSGLDPATMTEKEEREMAGYRLLLIGAEQKRMKEEQEKLRAENAVNAQTEMDARMKELEALINDPAHDFTEEEAGEYGALKMLSMLNEASLMETTRLVDPTTGLTSESIASVNEQRDKLIAEIKDLRKQRAAAVSPADKTAISNMIEQKQGEVANLDIIENSIKEKQNDLYRQSRWMLGVIIESGHNELKRQIQQEADRRRDIAHEGYEDIKRKGKEWIQYDKSGKRIDLEHRGKMRGFIHNLFGTALDSFDYMAQAISTSQSGQGYIYRRFVEGDEGLVAAHSNHVAAMARAKAMLDEKCKELLGMNFKRTADRYSTVEQSTGIYYYPEDREGNPQQTELPCSKGTAMYLYQLWQMNDGRMKLAKMGFTEESMAQIESFIGANLVDLANWMVTDYYPQLRERMNSRHKELYFTSMAEVQNYVPIHIDRTALKGQSDMAEGGAGSFSDSLKKKNGSIVNRTVNVLPIDLSRTAFDVLAEHTDKNEEWIAYARVRQDLDYLLNGIAFRNQLNANSRGRYADFEKACRTAALLPSQSGGGTESAMRMLTAGVVSGAISFKLWTAFKQILSYPAFFGYSQDPIYMVKLVPYFFNFAGNYKWATKNLPSFQKRIEEGLAASSDLVRELNGMSDGAFKRLLSGYSKWGMVPNKFVDAITCAAGARAIYELEYKRAIKSGASAEEAKSVALRKADIAYNETQQSNLGTMKSEAQTSQNFASKMVTTFQQSNLGFTRKAVLALNDIIKGIKDQKKQVELRMEIFGESESEAKKKVWNNTRKGVVNVGLFGFGLKILWDLAPSIFAGIMSGFQNGGGDDGEDEDKTLLEKLLWFGGYLYQGTLGGNIMHDIQGGGSYNPMSILTNSEIKELAKIYDDYGVSPELMAQTLIAMSDVSGVKIDTWANVAIGAQDMVSHGFKSDVAMDVSLILNMPKSMRKELMERRVRNYTPMEYAEAMAFAMKKENASSFGHLFKGTTELKPKDMKEYLKEYESRVVTPESKERWDEFLMSAKLVNKRKLKSYKKGLREVGIFGWEPKDPREKMVGKAGEMYSNIESLYNKEMNRPNGFRPEVMERLIQLKMAIRNLSPRIIEGNDVSTEWLVIKTEFKDVKRNIQKDQKLNKKQMDEILVNDFMEQLIETQQN